MEREKTCKVIMRYDDYEEAVYLHGDALDLAGKLDDLFGFFDEHEVIVKPKGSARGQEWRFNMYTEIE